MPPAMDPPQDYAKCSWPDFAVGASDGDEGQLGGHHLASWADSLNDAGVDHPDGGAGCTGQGGSATCTGGNCGRATDVISFSHFIPDQRLMPEKRFLMYPNLVGEDNGCRNVFLLN